MIPAQRLSEAAGAPSPAGSDRRRFGRLNCQEITSSLGFVSDLSGGGLRVLSRRKPCLAEGAPYECTLHTPLGTLTVPTRIARIRKHGYARFEIGLQFEELSPESRQTLNLLARSLAQPLPRLR